MRESYDGRNVCDNQKDFNVAVRKAVENNREEIVKEVEPLLYVYMILWLVFFVWALMLAMQVPKGPNRVVHLVLAMAFSPLYVIAHYVGAMKQHREF